MITTIRILKVDKTDEQIREQQHFPINLLKKTSWKEMGA